MKRTFMTAGLLSLGALAMALPTFIGVFSTTYKVSKTSELGKAACSVCHMAKKGGKLNPYGKDLAVVMKAEKTKKLTAELLHKIEKLDSTKTGTTNLAKINAGKNLGVD